MRRTAKTSHPGGAPILQDPLPLAWVLPSMGGGGSWCPGTEAGVKTIVMQPTRLQEELAWCSRGAREGWAEGEGRGGLRVFPPKSPPGFLPWSTFYHLLISALILKSTYMSEAGLGPPPLKGKARHPNDVRTPLCPRSPMGWIRLPILGWVSDWPRARGGA